MEAAAVDEDAFSVLPCVGERGIGTSKATGVLYHVAISNGDTTVSANVSYAPRR